MSAHEKPFEKPRHLPYDVEVEQALLGIFIVNPSNYHRLNETFPLTDQDFFDPLHGRIFEAIRLRFEREEMITPLTLNAALKADPGLMEVGGHGYLINLAQGAPSLPNVIGYAKILRDLATRRKLIRVGEDMVMTAYETPDELGDPSKMADEYCEAIYDVAHSDEIGRGTERLIDVVDRAIGMAEEAQKNPDRAVIKTGLPTVDRALGGLFPRDVTYLGAAPSMGKSGLGAQFGLHAARTGYYTQVFSKEMAGEEFATRYIAQEATIPANRIIEGCISVAEMERVALSRNAFLDLPYYMDSSTNLTVAQMRARCQATRRRRGRLDLVIIDHLKFIRPANPRDDFTEQMNQITRDLKALAKDLGVAVLCIAHLNREFWKRAGHRPTPSDLYGSSAIEQNADHIWFLHREDYYLEREQPDGSDSKAHTDWLAKCEKAKGWAEVFSAKRRGGPTGNARIRFDGPMVRFVDPEADIASKNADDLAAYWTGPDR